MPSIANANPSLQPKSDTSPFVDFTQFQRKLTPKEEREEGRDAIARIQFALRKSSEYNIIQFLHLPKQHTLPPPTQLRAVRRISSGTDDGDDAAANKKRVVSPSKINHHQHVTCCPQGNNPNQNLQWAALLTPMQEKLCRTNPPLFYGRTR